LHRALTGRPVRLVLVLVSSVSIAWAQSASQRRPTGVTCTGQDSLFAAAFDKSGLLIGLGLFLFVAPMMLSFLSRWWWSAKPIWRWAAPAALSMLLVFVPFIVLPWAGWQGWIPGDKGLLFYPGVDPTYLLCGELQVRSQKVFLGLFGHPDRVLIIQPYWLILAFAVAFVLWSVLWYGVFLLCRSRWGLRALAR
jgi:hypothetical protein